MDRMSDVKALVVELYAEFNEKLGFSPPELDIDDPKSVEKAFERVFNADFKATRNKTEFPRALSLNLRKSFADLLLLFDGKDIKVIKEAKDAKENATSEQKE